MNRYSSETCQYCGSTLHRRFGHPHCSGDNLSATKRIFDDILELEPHSPHFSTRLEYLQETELVFDLFMSYWNHKKRDPETCLDCIHAEVYTQDLTPRPTEIPMPEPFTPFPDLVEVYLAEVMLGRELVDLEKDGSRAVPKINERGDFFWAPLTWVSFPHSYMSTYKSDGQIKGLEPLPKIFDIEAIRGKYAGR